MPTFTPPPADPPEPPEAPQRLAGEVAFIERANALAAWYAPFVKSLRGLVAWLGTFQSEATALQVDMTQKAGATTSAAAAAAASADAASMAAAAAAAAAAHTGAAPAFAPGTLYGRGDVAVSPSSLHTYRARSTGVRHIDPALDAGNWLDLQFSGAKAFYFANL